MMLYAVKEKNDMILYFFLGSIKDGEPLWVGRLTFEEMSKRYKGSGLTVFLVYHKTQERLRSLSVPKKQSWV